MAGDGIQQMLDMAYKLRNKLPDTLEKTLRKAHSSAMKKSAIEVLTPIREEYKKVIRESFYDKYEPRYYTNRRYSMEDMLELEMGEIETSTSENSFSVKLHYDVDKMTYRDGSSGLADLTFGMGYHGGAYSYKKHDASGEYVYYPHYRYPRDSWIFWGQAAVRTESPYEAWQQWLSDYAKSDIFQKAMEKNMATEMKSILSNIQI